MTHGCGNGLDGLPESPEGGPESRLWAAVVERGQEARTARHDEERWTAEMEREEGTLLGYEHWQNLLHLAGPFALLRSPGDGESKA